MSNFLTRASRQKGHETSEAVYLIEINEKNFHGMPLASGMDEHGIVQILAGCYIKKYC